MSNIRSKANQPTPTYYSNPGNDLSSLAGKLTGKLLPVILMTGIFLLSTSYHSRYEEMQLIENQYFLPELTSSISETLNPHEKNLYITVNGNDLLTYDLIRSFYWLQDFNPSFTTYNDLNEQGIKALDLLGKAQYYGLEPGNYHAEMIRNLQLQLQNQGIKQQHIQIREEIELLFADAVLKFMIHLHSGYRIIDSALLADPYVASLPTSLRQAFSEDNLIAYMLSSQPEFIEYERLQRATEQFVQQVKLTENWVPVADMQDDSVLLWRGIYEVLQRLGYSSSSDNRYSDITEALMTFQLYHGLETDGRPGKNTLEALGQSSMHKYRIMALNLDRLRKLEQHQDCLLFVNVPSYTLKVIKENNIRQTYRVCVGRTYSPTPLIDGNIDLIVTNPEWNVPNRIARHEILPRIKSDETYLKRNRFTILDTNRNVVNYEEIDWTNVSAGNFNYSIQQNPGSDNALGQVKFLFDNPYSVYLHDTQSKSLFAEDIRAFSHGCVRVENPGELAAYLVEQLQPEYLDVRDLINSGIRYEIRLQNSIPLQIRYITCAGDENGGLYCYKDIYGLDAREIEDFLVLASM